MKYSRRDFLKFGLGSAAAFSLAGAVDLGLWARRAAAQEDAMTLPEIINLEWPLFSNPAMLQKGDKLPIRLKPDTGPLEKVILEGEDGIDIPVDMAADGDNWIATLPDDLAPGAYNLIIQSGGVTEAQVRAVGLYEQFKDDFDFVFVADIHFGEHDGKFDGMITPDMTQYYTMRARALTEIEKYNPEFIVLGGDLALYPKNYNWGYLEAYAFLINYLKSPLHIVPGNHDVYHMDVEEMGGEHVWGKKYWDKYYGAKYHSFDYGKLHVSCLNTSDWEDKFLHWGTENTTSGSLLSTGISKEQYMWLKDDLAAAAGQAESVICCHIPLHNIVSGMRAGMPPQNMPGASEERVFKLLESSNVKRVFVGHLHINKDQLLTGDIQEHMIRNVGGSYFESKDAGFAVVHVRGGKIDGFDRIDLKA